MASWIAGPFVGLSPDMVLAMFVIGAVWYFLGRLAVAGERAIRETDDEDAEE